MAYSLVHQVPSFVEVSMNEVPLRLVIWLIFSLFALPACDRDKEIQAMEPFEIAQNAAKVAETVRQKAHATEKAEGKQDLVKDKVTVKTSTTGEPVIEQTGEASSYGRGFEGKKTANGEKFDKNDLTAAHPTLPLGTKATVTNLENGKSVDVRINDRGPYVKGRDIDVSQGAAKELDMDKNGVAPVKIEAKVPPSDISEGGGSSPAVKETAKPKK
ncbi:MAG TPA: septal ring lytic transglycosylase RlpA family protein [Candidatus Limnocylindrales bacterium]|nr:septal ring lytic transglycosylase RlpA family protein [Candidatus Limnocylindrales bacterium]